MQARIGFLLPRSTEFPSMSFDLLDGLRTHLSILGLSDCQIFTNNIGFGDDASLTHSAAEKLILENDVHVIVAYATSLNAETLYGLADTCSRPFLFLDAGMEVFEAAPNPHCFHLTLQGLEACVRLGKQAAEVASSVLSASSFLDGGYRSTWAFQLGLESKGGSFSGHFISHYLPAEFTMVPFTNQILQDKPQAVLASYSSYLNQLFLTKLKDEPESSHSIPFYCAPFMADEQLLESIPFPGGTLHTIVPWASSLDNPSNTQFISSILSAKKKKANLFHLLGWEAASVVQRIVSGNDSALGGWSFESPRGTVSFHPETNCAYAPLYTGFIAAGENGKSSLQIREMTEVHADDHRKLFFMRPTDGYSRWKNNYFCI
jgi:branched-chain amino acid transport system substrate-binding protein